MTDHSDKQEPKKNIKHGLSRHPIMATYNGMRNRCYSDKSISYKHYGGRGISICDEWVNDFMAFYNWSIANGWAQSLQIDRIDVNGNYGPDNCRWVTDKQQQRNRRSNRYITYEGVTRSMAEWAEVKGLNYHTLQQRLDLRGWPMDKVFIKASRKNQVMRNPNSNHQNKSSDRP